MADSSSGPANSSLQQFVTVLIVNLIIFAVFILLFVHLRKKQSRVYEPRHSVQTVPKELVPDESPRGWFSWLGHLLKKPESYIIQQTAADGYFFMRFIFSFAMISFLGCCLLWPILFPVNATNGNGAKGFDILSYSNVKNKWRSFAHVFLSWVFFGSVTFLIYREIVYYTTFRHVLQTTPLYDSLLSSRTLLLTEIPSTLYNESELRALFPTASNIWYAREFKELQEKVKERTKLAKKYEGALNSVLSKAVKLRLKAEKKNKPVPEPADDLNKYLKDGKKRPTHKLKFLIGEKVDTLNYGAEHLGELNTDIKKSQREYAANRQLPAVFIEFPTQLELQKAYQAIPYGPDLKGVGRRTGLTPDDVIWSNLDLTPSKRRIKKVLANTFLTVMIIFWAIPVAVVGAISNINMLTDKVHFLRFILNLPSVLLGLITGLLPVVALAVLMSLVPPIIKKAGKIAGCLTVQEVEGYCQSWYYAFQVVNVFLVFTLTSAAASSVTSIISDPTSALNLLGNKIPPASNFYIANTCYQGLSISSGILLQIVALILAQFLGRILDKTPRAKWTRANTLGQPGWSTTYPAYQLMGSISLIYAIIAPLILGFTTIAFMLIYFAWIYTLVYVQQPNKTDARGRFYPRAWLQMFTGIYLGEVCLIALFVFRKNWAAVALEGFWIVVTALAHIHIKWMFLPLFDTVPISAIKYAAGDQTFQYPMHDQGYREIRSEGKNYWEGGNQLGLTENPRDQVLPELPSNKAPTTLVGSGSDESVKQDVNSGYTGESRAGNTLANKEARVSDADTDLEKAPPSVDPESRQNNNLNISPQAGVGFLARFFRPKTETFELIRKIMPDAYFNYVEYNASFLKNAYNDPAVIDEEPHIWIPRDNLGLSEIEKNKALEHGVDCTDENASFDEKGNVIYSAPPPAYEEALKM